MNYSNQKTLERDFILRVFRVPFSLRFRFCDVVFDFDCALFY